MEFYQQHNIDVYDAQGQLRSLYDILSDLAPQWDSLSTNEKDYYLNQQAGANQTQNLAAIMENFDAAIGATETAINSAGSAAGQNAVYMESLQAHITEVQAAFQELSNSVVDSELVKTLLDLAKNVLDLLNTKAGTMITQMTLLTGLLFGGSGLIRAMKLLDTTVFAAGKTFLTFIDVVKETHTALVAAKTAEAAATATTNGLGTALKLLSKNAFLVSAAISAVVVIGYALIKAWQKANPSLDELNDKLTTNKERLEELNNVPAFSRTSDIQAEIDALTEENEKLQEQIDLTNQIKRGTPEEVQHGYVSPVSGDTSPYSAVVNGITYEANSIDDLKKKLQEAGVVTEDFIGDLAGLGIEVKVSQDAISSDITTLQNYEAQVSAGIALTGDQTAEYTALYDSLSTYKDNLIESADGVENLNEAQQAQISSINYLLERYDTLTSKFSQQQGILTNLAKGLSITTGEYNVLIKAFPQLNDYLSEQNGLWSLNSDALISAAESGDSWAISMIDNLMNVTKAISQTVEAINTLDTSAYWTTHTTEAEARRAKLGSYLSTLEALKEASNTGKNLNKSTGDTNNTGDTTTTTTTTTTDTTDKVLNNLKSIVSLRKSELTLLENSNASTDAQIAKHKQIQSALHDEAEYMRSNLAKMKSEGASESEIADYQADINALSSEWWTQQSKINDLLEEAKETEKEILENRLSDLQEQQSRYETTFSYIAKLIDNEISALEEQEEAENTAYNNKLSALEETNEELEEQIELEEALANLAKAKQTKKYVLKDGRFQYVEDIDAVAEAQATLDSLKRSQALEEEKENLKEEHEATVATIESEIDYWEKYQEKWSSVVDDYADEQDKLIAEQELGIKLEGQNWEKRLDNLEGYIDDYKALLSEITDLQYEIDNIEQTTTEYNATTNTGEGYTGKMTAKLPDGSYTTVTYVNGVRQTSLPTGAVVRTEGGYYRLNADGSTTKVSASEFTGSSSSSSSSSSGSSSSSSSSSGSSSSSSSSSGYTGTKTSGSGSSTYTINSDKGKDFVSNASAGSTMTGGDGSTWTKNSDGSTTITKNGNTYTVKGNAHGTLGFEGGLSLVGEQGPELRVLNQGDGIIPADITKNLWAWGKLNPSAILNNVFSGITPNSSQVISISNITLPNVTNAQTFYAGLKEYAMQYASKR